MRVVRQKSGVSARSVVTGIIVIAVVLWFLLGGPFYIVGPEERAWSSPSADTPQRSVRASI